MLQILVTRAEVRHARLSIKLLTASMCGGVVPQKPARMRARRALLHVTTF
jgi:hypothetical protein